MESRRLIVQNFYRLRADVSAFDKALRRLVQRVEHAGHDGVLSYQFFSNEQDRSARGVIVYCDPEAWVGHHDISMNWPEMVTLHEAAILEEVVFLGPFTPEIDAWLKNSKLKAKLLVGNRFSSGFDRNEPSDDLRSIESTCY